MYITKTHIAIFTVLLLLLIGFFMESMINRAKDEIYATVDKRITEETQLPYDLVYQEEFWTEVDRIDSDIIDVASTTEWVLFDILGYDELK